MAGGKITQYDTIDVLLFPQDDDLYDVSQIVEIIISPPSVVYGTRSVTWSQLVTAMSAEIAGGNTIYTADDSLTGNRTVDIAGFDLIFDTNAGNFIVKTGYSPETLKIQDSGAIDWYTNTYSVQSNTSTFLSGANTNSLTLDSNGVTLESTDTRITINAFTDIFLYSAGLTPGYVLYLDGTNVIKTTSIALADLESGGLPWVLGLNSTTNETEITSANTYSSFRLYNASSTLQFSDGTNDSQLNLTNSQWYASYSDGTDSGTYSIESTQSTLTHTQLILLDAPIITIGQTGSVINFIGTAVYETQINSYVTDKLMTLNYGGGAATATGTGFEIEENSIITGYFKTNSARTGFEFLAPANTYKGTLLFNSLGADRSFTLPNATGTIVLNDNTAALTNKTYEGLTITATTGTLTIASGKTATISNTLTFTGTDSSSVAFGAGGTVTYTSNKLSVFAATTSAELAGVISDETGTGVLVFNSAPALLLPTISDSTTPTKTIAFTLSGATAAKTLTLISAHTDNRSITFPDATTTLVGTNTTDTLTNKTLSGASNTFSNIPTSAITGYQGYAITYIAAQWSPADATTYAVGALTGAAGSTTVADVQTPFPKAGTIKRIDVVITNAGTLGSNEQGSLNFRLNNTTDTLLSSTVTSNATWQIFTATGLSISIAAGDYGAIKYTTPTWATNPTNLRLVAIIYVE